MEHTGFPSDETLAAFLDGKLDPDTRRRVVEHMTTCDECYATVVGGGGIRHFAETREVRNQPSRARLAAGFGLAAAFAAALYLGPLRKQSPSRQKTAMQRVADAAPSTWTIDERLTGIHYDSPKHITRGGGERGDSGNSAMWKLLGVAGEINEISKRSPTVDNLHATGIASLLLSDHLHAVDSLEAAALADTHQKQIASAIARTRDAELLSDLSAAYLEQAKTGPQHARDYLAAVDAAEHAHALKPHSAAIAWNRAVAVEKLYMPQRTEAAWDDYLVLDSTSKWAELARQRRAAARPQTDTDEWQLREKAVRDAAIRSSAPELRTLTEGHLGDVRTSLTAAIRAWADAKARGDESRSGQELQVAASLGDVLYSSIGDLSGKRSVAAIQLSNTMRAGEVYCNYFTATDDLRSGKYEKAVDSIPAALSYFRITKTPFELLGRLVLVRCDFGLRDYASALLAAQLVATEASAAGYWDIAGQALLLEALSKGIQGRRHEAVALYVEAVAAYESASEPLSAARAEALMAEAEHYVGRNDEAWWHWCDAVHRLSRAAESPWRSTMLAIAATTAREDGFPGAATQLISGSIAKAVAHSADEVAALHDAYVMRAELEGSNGLQDEALGDIDRAKQLEPALASEKHRARAVAFTARVEAEILSDHNPRLAYSLLTTAIDTAGRVGDGSLAELRYARAALLLQMGAPDTEIMTELRSGVDALDHAISGVVVTDRAEDTAERLYRHLVPMLIKAGAAREALDYCERYRRTAIVREGSRARTDSTFRPDRDPGIATVSYLFAGDGDRLCLFFSRKGQTIAVVEPISEELLAAIVNRLWRAADVATCEAALKELSLRLLYPLKLSLAGITTLVIAPDGILNRIPFAALRTSDGLHLIEHAAVVRMPFVYSNKAAMYERIDRHGVLVIGNPTFARREFRLLPDISESEREARAVAGLYDRSVIFVGADATRDAFTRTAPHASVIQIAAHAMSNEASPLDAALLLAEDRARRDDGVLYAREVAGLHLLHTRLVVLSTCTSGGAERTFSVGSLADAFITAGVHNVVDTLCDVRDAAASEFVMRFHSRLKSGQPIVTAFHNTQLEYSRRNCDLDCWAAFELTVGDLT